MTRVYITKSKAGHYLVTVRRNGQVFQKSERLSSLQAARYWVKTYACKEVA